MLEISERSPDLINHTYHRQVSLIEKSRMRPQSYFSVLPSGEVHKDNDLDQYLSEELFEEEFEFTCQDQSSVGASTLYSGFKSPKALQAFMNLGIQKIQNITASNCQADTKEPASHLTSKFKKMNTCNFGDNSSRDNNISQELTSPKRDLRLYSIEDSQSESPGALLAIEYKRSNFSVKNLQQKPIGSTPVEIVKSPAKLPQEVKAETAESAKKNTVGVKSDNPQISVEANSKEPTPNVGDRRLSQHVVNSHKKKLRELCDISKSAKNIHSASGKKQKSDFVIEDVSAFNMFSSSKDNNILSPIEISSAASKNLKLNLYVNNAQEGEPFDKDIRFASNIGSCEKKVEDQPLKPRPSETQQSRDTKTGDTPTDILPSEKENNTKDKAAKRPAAEVIFGYSEMNGSTEDLDKRASKLPTDNLNTSINITKESPKTQEARPYGKLAYTKATAQMKASISSLQQINQLPYESSKIDSCISKSYLILHKLELSALNQDRKGSKKQNIFSQTDRILQELNNRDPEKTIRNKSAARALVKERAVPAPKQKEDSDLPRLKLESVFKWLKPKSDQPDKLDHRDKKDSRVSRDHRRGSTSQNRGLPTSTKCHKASNIQPLNLSKISTGASRLNSLQSPSYNSIQDIRLGRRITNDIVYSPTGKASRCSIWQSNPQPRYSSIRPTEVAHQRLFTSHFEDASKLKTDRTEIKPNNPRKTVNQGVKGGLTERKPNAKLDKSTQQRCRVLRPTLNNLSSLLNKYNMAQ